MRSKVRGFWLSHGIFAEGVPVEAGGHSQTRGPLDCTLDVADLLGFEMPVAVENEHRLALELGRLRCLEAASVIAALAARQAPEIAA